MNVSPQKITKEKQFYRMPPNWVILTFEAVLSIFIHFYPFLSIFIHFYLCKSPKLQPHGVKILHGFFSQVFIRSFKEILTHIMYPKPLLGHPVRIFRYVLLHHLLNHTYSWFSRVGKSNLRFYWWSVWWVVSLNSFLISSRPCMLDV